MFLHVSVCPWGAGWYPSMPCRWYPSMPCRSPGGSQGPHPGGKLRGLAGGLQAHTQGGSWGVWPGGSLGHTWEGVSRPTPRGCVSQHALGRHPPVDGYCHGQYASYWNAFLFQLIFFKRNFFSVDTIWLCVNYSASSGNIWKMKNRKNIFRNEIYLYLKAFLNEHEVNTNSNGFIQRWPTHANFFFIYIPDLYNCSYKWLELFSGKDFGRPGPKIGPNITENNIFQ